MGRCLATAVRPRSSAAQRRSPYARVPVSCGRGAECAAEEAGRIREGRGALEHVGADAVGAQDPDRDPVAAGATRLRLDAAPVWIVAGDCDAARLVVVAHGRLLVLEVVVFGNRVSDSGRCRIDALDDVVFRFGLASSFRRRAAGRVCSRGRAAGCSSSSQPAGLALGRLRTLGDEARPPTVRDVGRQCASSRANR